MSFSSKARVSPVGQVFGLRHWSFALAAFFVKAHVCLASALLRLLQAAGVLGPAFFQPALRLLSCLVAFSDRYWVVSEDPTSRSGFVSRLL